MVYGPAAGVREKSIKNRFDDLMAFVRERQNLVPFRSGCDNEPASEGELASALDGLYEIITDSIAEREATTVLTAKRKAVEAANAEVLRDASLGMLTEKKRKSIQHKNKRSNSLTSPGDGSGSKGTPATVAAGSNKKVQSGNSDIFLTSALTVSRAIAFTWIQRRRKRGYSKRQRQCNGSLNTNSKWKIKRANVMQRMQLELQTQMFRFMQPATTREVERQFKRPMIARYQVVCFIQQH